MKFYEIIIKEFIEANWSAFESHCNDYNTSADEIMKESGLDK